MQVTVKEWLNEWLDVYVKTCRKENTYLCYKYIIKMIFKHRPEVAKLSLEDIDELYLQRMLNEFSQYYSKSTLNKVKIVFKSGYNAAIRNHHSNNNPARYLEIPEASEKEIRALTREEEKIVIEAAKKDILGHIAIFLLLTGIRSCELRNLKWSDYHPETNEIYIRISKTKAGVRIVPLISETKKIIESQPHICDYIFTSTIKRPVTKTVLRRLYERLRKATGIDIVTNHVYRHSFATRAVEKKMDYKALSRILGHKNVAFTLHRYTDPDNMFLHEQMALMETHTKRKVMKIKNMHVKRW